MKFEKLQPGMVVYDVHKHKMGNTTVSTVGVWRVQIVSIDTDNRCVTASWNGNPEKKFYSRDIEAWREKEPILVRQGIGNYRLATRDELKAARAIARAVQS